MRGHPKIHVDGLIEWQQKLVCSSLNVGVVFLAKNLLEK
jgi:hypothetical protein